MLRAARDPSFRTEDISILKKMSFELCEDEHDAIVLLRRNPSFFG